VTAAGTLITQKPRRTSWWKQLWVWVLIGMALGIVLGMAMPDLAGQMGPLGDAFIKLIRMLVAPIIFCTVVTGIAHMADMARIGRVAIKAIIYFEVMTTIALIIGLVAVNIMQPGVGMNVDVGKLNPSVVEPYVKLTHEVGFIPFLMNIIPNTFVGAFSEGNILQVLFIAVLSGFALVWLGEELLVSRSGFCRSCCDVRSRKQHTRRERRLNPWHPPFDVSGAHAHQLPR